MSFTIYYPATSAIIVVILSYMFVYSILVILNIGNDGIIVNDCKNLFRYFILHVIVTVFYIISLISINCFPTGRIRFLMTLIYYLSFITIRLALWSNLNCYGAYNNSKEDDDYGVMFYTENDNNVLIFFRVLRWNIISALITFNLIVLSFIYSQVVRLFSSSNCKETCGQMDSKLYIISKNDKMNDEMLIKPY
jgi:hypothetical protein